MKVIVSVLIAVMVAMVSVSFAEDADTTQSSDMAPRISVPESEYNFDTALEGEKVVHTFVVRNTGDAPLEITKIKTTCGCTTAEYTKGEIPPGGEGEVTLQVSTKGYGGKTIKKTATLYSNDPEEKSLKLKISGTVEVFADISPKSIKFVGTTGEKLREVVQIVPSEAHPFHIVGEPETSKDTYRCTLEEKDGKYILTAENLATEATTYFGTVVMKTDLPEYPEISISVIGKIKSQEQSE